ncbi:MAG: translocation/assembly module TamB, partial [Flavobacteriaceae bacterium]|nr:translocation/assembly module TamB [Flavobacteriaceae bacterium]
MKQLLPNILGNTLPSVLNKFGRFSLAGQSYITEEIVNANIVINSALGRSVTDLELTNIDDIDNAKYKGQVEFIDLDFGKIVNDSLIGKLSLVADVDGQGFTLDKLDTRIRGTISKHQYKGYTYSNIDVNGIIKNQLFDGQLITNDDNLKMNFNGLADLSTKDYKFDFNADVAYSDFNKLNLFKEHSKAILKGKINIKLTGNTFDNIFGTIDFKDASYSNHVDDYYFKDFNVTSTFQDTVRIITVNSTDIVDGTLKGRFKYEELPQLAKNSLGSIYTNYEPDRVSSGQFLDFNFKIYNQIVEVFYPKVNLGSNSTIKGKINANQNKFELLVKSPRVEAYENIIEDIRLQIDNKNPLYNTLLSLGKLNTKYYNLADLNLVNVTLNDTLFFRTDFVGGERLQEKFDLSFYHTLNKNNQSVIGLKPSRIKFKENDWKINPSDNNQNKIVFDEKLQTFAFDRINAVSGDQEIDLLGVITDDTNKNLSLNLKDVKLEGITPNIDSLSLTGLVNGRLNYRQINGTTLPIAQIIVDDFYINKYSQGTFIVDAQGGSSLKKYIINATLQNEITESIEVQGEVDFEPDEPTIFANYALNKFKIDAFSPLGEDVLNTIRGEISGKGIVTGLLKNPDIDGDLALENGGLAFPYLNVNYDFIGKSKIELNKQTFTFLPTTLLDVVHDTEARLSGRITHNEFKKWFLDININTDNLLVLNTEESEEIPYYGTGFIQGNASISGYTDQLVIDVEGKTMPGSEFIVPLNDVSTIGDSKLVQFISKTEKGDDENVVEEVVFEGVKGLTLNFFLEATDDALAEIVVDRNTGSILRGRGFGNFDITINTNGKFEVIGTYVVSEGIYEFRNIVNKDFIVQPGGSVSWEGNPFDAYLNNITAVYRTQANPSVLLDNVNTTRELDVDLIAKISGQLLNSDIEFDLDIPNSNSLVNSELQFKLSDQNRKMTQFFSLLVSGAFTNIDEGGIGIDAGVAGTSLLSEKISSVLSNLLQSRGEKFNVGVSY